MLHYNEPPLLKAERIKKIRNPKGVPCYEIIWSHSGFIEQQNELSSIEPQHLIETAYPDLVAAYKKSKIKPQKRKKATKKVDELEKMLQNTSISEPIAKKKMQTIDSYFKRAVVNNFVEKVACSTPVKKGELLTSSFEDDEDDADLSDIVSEIIQQKPNFFVAQQEQNGSFFMGEPAENDVFEATFNELCGIEDSFVISEVPLLERLQNKKLNLLSQ